jgi:uncharacterized protein (TIGR04255 family)
MSNAPVCYALAQAQFNPIAAMTKYVDEVQDRLRREGYTLYEPHHVSQFQFAATPSQTLAEPQVTQVTNWLITKGDRSSGFILTPSSISFHTTHYETSKEFIPALLGGLKAVHEVVGLDHVARLGLRYLDAVLPQPDETVDQYLADGLQGVRFGATQKYGLNESVFETETGPLSAKGTLVARIFRLTGPLGFPPDMIPNGLVPQPKFDRKDILPHAVIDTDHFVEGPMALDFDKLGEQLTSLHQTIRQVFDKTISRHAEAVWA